MRRILSLAFMGSLCALIAACADANGGGGGGGGGGGDDLGAGGGGGGGGGGEFDLAGFLSPDLNGCASDTQTAKPLPLDIYLMLDTSGSMSQQTGTGSNAPTKWQAVRTALTSFVNDPASAGIGLGLQYFPIVKPGTTAQTCANDAACGANAPCINNRACAKAGPVQFCKVDADCGGNTKCADLGTCALGGSLCLSAPQYGCAVGPCNYFTLSYCSGRDSCTINDYATPAVDIAPLPGVASAITTSMNARSPDGLTPTAPALSGAIQRAKTYATANPGHTVITVLATDGFPTECTPQDIPTIAASAAAGVSSSPSVKTFVIGVFTQAEQQQATTNLNQIAAAGGTNQAFIINTSQNVAQQFLAALNQIRGASLPCEYTLPVPASGTPDYSAVNVQFTSGMNSAVIGYARSQGMCDPTRGGWYYDVDPASGTPTKVILCPASCTAVKSDPNGRIDIVQGCATTPIF
jgi:hypothetical protein